MEMRITEHGSKRYSFPLGAKDPSEVLRIFERGNKLSIHFVHKRHPENKLKSLNQFIIAVRDNKMYMYHTSGRECIRGLTLDRAVGLTISMAKTIFLQSADNKKMGMGSIASVKRIIRDFLKSQIEWYPKVSCTKVKIMDLLALGSSKIIADRYAHEGILSQPHGVAQNILRHSTTLRELSKKVFGFTSPWAMRESIKILDGHMPYGLVFKKILPVDSIKKLYGNLKQGDNIGSMYWFLKIPEMRRFLKMFHQDTIVNWYKQRCDDSYYSSEADRYLHDTIRMWNMIPEEVRELPRGENNLRLIHDILSATQRKTAQSDYKLKIDKKAEKIDGEVVNGMKIIIPKTNYELIEWGSLMSNCIGSYGNSKTILLGIVKDHTLTYCLEVMGGRMWQFKAKYNHEAPEQDKKAIEEYLESKDILKVNRHEPVF